MKEASVSVRQVEPSFRLSLLWLQLDVNRFQHLFSHFLLLVPVPPKIQRILCQSQSCSYGLGAVRKPTFNLRMTSFLLLLIPFGFDLMEMSSSGSEGALAAAEVSLYVNAAFSRRQTTAGIPQRQLTLFLSGLICIREIIHNISHTFTPDT